MNEYAATSPLLLRKEDDLGCSKKASPFMTLLAKWIIRVAIFMIFFAWVTFIFLLPSDPVYDFFLKSTESAEEIPFGKTGRIFLLFCAPVLIIALLSTAYLIIHGEEDFNEKKNLKNPHFSLWTFPVLVDGPFGIVSAAEMIGILIFCVYIIWAVSSFTIRNFNDLSSLQVTSAAKRSVLMLEPTGLAFGFLGLMCLTFLFLPVARGSILLRYVHIPFEQAIRYHTWLGQFTVLFFTLHVIFYITAWTIQGRLLHELKDWKKDDVSPLPGAISLLALLTMWLTSLPGVRRKNFELFYYTHHLYMVLFILLALHVGDAIFCTAAAGIFLFMLDRFLRFCQSRRKVAILSATCFPCGSMELVLSKHANLHYNALSWVVLRVREVSMQQWHPFSVSSSPLDGKNYLSILIKVSGEWTGKLREHILSISKDRPQTQTLLPPHFQISASVEGPYGHESPYHLMYENLILVAGGIGISPFLSILSDRLHHLKNRKSFLPKHIWIIWTVKKSDELSLLQKVDMESICPFFSEALNLEIQIYVTRESGPPLEEGKLKEPQPPYSCVFRRSEGSAMSVLAGTGNIFLSGMYLMISTIGLVVLVGLLDRFYIKPFHVTHWWYKGLLFLACMVASVVLFGGSVICLWLLWERKTSDHEPMKDTENIANMQQNELGGVHKSSVQEKIVNSIYYGRRPDFEEIFRSISEQWGNVDIGVIACGPSMLQTSVARECRTHNLKRRNNQPIFHFNSHSFEL